MKPRRESGDFARGGVAMDRALRGGAIKRLGRELERFLGGRAVTGGNRFGRPFDRGVHAGLDQSVAGLALHALAMALFSGRMIRNMRHNLYDLTAAEGAVNIARTGVVGGFEKRAQLVAAPAACLASSSFFFRFASSLSLI
jgi:hypothetical protein